MTVTRRVLDQLGRLTLSHASRPPASTADVLDYARSAFALLGGGIAVPGPRGLRPSRDRSSCSSALSSPAELRAAYARGRADFELEDTDAFATPYPNELRALREAWLRGYRDARDGTSSGVEDLVRNADGERRTA